MKAALKINPSSREIIGEAIKKEIEAGKLLPGQELVQEKLAQAFGVSRMPVREALQALVLEGYVERLDNRHMQVAAPGSWSGKPEGAERKNKKKKNMTESVIGKSGRKKAGFKADLAVPFNNAPALEAQPLTQADAKELPLMNISRIHLLPAREMVASVLRKAILSRELMEGQEITLEGMAKYVGVSITPVREAFQILAGDGLIRLRPNKGALVLGVNAKTIHDHYETRAVLESEAAAKAAGKGVDISQIEEVYESACQSLKEERYQDYKKYNQSWHLAIWRAAGNLKMEMLLSSLWNGLSMGYKVTEQEYAQISMKEHALIMNAIRKHDAKQARKFMREHIHRSMENILTHLNAAKA